MMRFCALRSILFAVCLLLALLGLPRNTVAQEAPQGEQKTPWVEDSDTRPAEQAYKNIKVLSGIPANRLKTVMNVWKNSLGVECTFCHTRGEWDSDSIQEKGYAREMHKLTNDLATNYFEGKDSVTCYTCHRGEKVPAKRLPAAPVERRARPVQGGAGL